jgi:c-di-GMP-binding flagellar brake protein YcgR
MRKKELSDQRIERREAKRLRQLIRAEYRPKGKKSWIRTTCLNISGKGIKFLTDKPLRPKTIIEVMIQDQKKQLKPFIALCRVKWSKQIHEDEFQSGLNFLKTKDRDTIKIIFNV